MQTQTKATVLIRFKESRKELTEKGVILEEDKDKDETIWTTDKVEEIRQVLAEVEDKEGELKVRFDFTELCERLNIDKTSIYRKLVELYHDRRTIKEENQAAEEDVVVVADPRPLIKPKMQQSFLQRLQGLKLGSSSSVTKIPIVGEEDTDSSEVDDSSTSVINIASASMYLHRSQLLGKAGSKRTTESNESLDPLLE
ncbi:hypothetical protein FOA43_003020 [Brettanomyces nanus]|uniref:Uncharacterized protein n=1 Tax=Eeniella nana TaxID=13502 RepID=A0A875S6P8_EENNA|nr:uncharacterized protein FOA43_003020 [Brettanomyces nanus]QPG75662.1 hypothetical protein FOA43_003020 [Brettanomyces nanus]